MQPPILKESTKRASQNNKMHKINATKFFLLETLVLLFNLTRWKPFGKDFVWPDSLSTKVRPDQCVQIWQNFRHFGEILNVLGSFLWVYLLFGNILSLLWQILYAVGQIFIDVNGQGLKNNLDTWSHCSWSKAKKTFQSVLKHFFDADKSTQKGEKIRQRDRGEKISLKNWDFTGLFKIILVFPIQFLIHFRVNKIGDG